MKKKIIIIICAFFIIFFISFAGKCAYSALPTGTGIDTPANPRIFVSAATTTGAMGGGAVAMAYADSLCNTDTNKPTARTYKALMWSSTRDISKDWVLRANTTYFRSDGSTAIGNTDGSKKLVTTVAISTNATVFTGASTSLDYAYAGRTCLDWSSGSSLENGEMGNALNTGAGAFCVAPRECNDGAMHIYCVEQ